MSEKLLKALNENGRTDVVIPYHQIARIFPLDEPHPDSFDYKKIEHNALLAFASKHGWEVNTAPDKGKDNFSPPIRFIKINV